MGLETPIPAVPNAARRSIDCLNDENWLSMAAECSASRPSTHTGIQRVVTTVSSVSITMIARIVPTAADCPRRLRRNTPKPTR
jgi:hypothetical protein